jgi:hypothetical protein
MKEELEELYYGAVRELKRVDHMIYVSLKYTRTVDVIKSLIERMICSFDFQLDMILEYFKEKGKIESYQRSPGLKCSKIRELTDDDTINEIVVFYLLLRRLTRAEFETINEYKRHVGMVVTNPDGTEIIVNIDLVTEYYKIMKEYIAYVHNFVSEGEEEE